MLFVKSKSLAHFAQVMWGVGEVEVGTGREPSAPAGPEKSDSTMGCKSKREAS